MAKCVEREFIEQALRRIRQAKEIDRNQDKETRVDVWEVKDHDVFGMFTNFTADGIFTKRDKNGDPLHHSKSVEQKTKGSLDAIHSKYYPDVHQFIAELQNTGTFETGGQRNHNRDARNQAIALKEIFDSVEGEINKANKEGIQTSEIAGDGNIPYIPLHRLAATIGRKIGYLSGFRYLKIQDGVTDNSVAVEHAYYIQGMLALERLAKVHTTKDPETGEVTTTGGFIKIHDTGKPSIKDYLSDKNAKRDYTKKIIHYAAVLEINTEKFGVTESQNPNVPNPDLKYFTNRAQANIVDSKLNAYVRAINAINHVSQPETITMPHTSPVNGVRKNQDHYELPSEIEGVREELESHPLVIAGPLHELFSLMNKELEKSKQSASVWIANVIKDDVSLRNLFGVDRINLVAANEASHAGQNLSKTVPLNDVIENYSGLVKGNDPADLYMAMFGGRNFRLYTENSVVNPQASKLMRHALEVGEFYSMEVGSPELNWHMKKVALRLGQKVEGSTTEIDFQSVLDVSGATRNGRGLNQALELFDQFEVATTARAKVKLIVEMERIIQGLDFTDLVTTLGAVSDIREGLKSKDKKVVTSYMTNTDATAYGGSTIIKSAIGTNPEAITELLVQLGQFKDDDSQFNKPKLADIYDILQIKLNEFVFDEPDVTEVDYDVRSVDGDTQRIKDLIRLVSKVLYRGNIRNLSKGPTMTFIYQQTEPGARYSLSEEFEGLLTDLLGGKTITGDTIELLNLVLQPVEPYTNDTAGKERIRGNLDIKLEVRAAFAASGMPTYLFNTLTDSLIDEYLGGFKARGEQVMEYSVNKKATRGMRAYGAGHVVQAAINGEKLIYDKEHLERMGATVSKVFEVENLVGDDVVLTREEQVLGTVMGTSHAGHSVDTSSSYRAIKGIPTRHGLGMVVVHEDIRGSSPAVMEAEEQFLVEDKNSALYYDVHEQMMLAAAVWDTSLNSNAEYNKLLEEIQAAKLVKQEILERLYDLETDSIIGDKINTDAVKQPRAKAKTFKKVAATDPLDILKDLENDSSIIETFLKLDPKMRSNLEAAPVPKFSTSSDTIGISDQDTRVEGKTTTRSLKTKVGRKNIVELIEHEIVHSYTLGLIADYINRRTKVSSSSPERDVNFRYVDNTVEKLFDMAEGGQLEKKLSKKSYARLTYALYQGSQAKKIAEFIAIMSTEPAVAAEIYKLLGSSTKSKLQRVLELIKAKVIQIMDLVSYRDLESGVIEADKLFNAINSIIIDGTSARSVQADTDAVRKLQEWFEEDIYAGPQRVESQLDFSNPINYLNASVARGINDPLIRHAGDLLKQSNNYLRGYPMYRLSLQKLSGLYEDSTALQQLVGTITGGGTSAFLDFKNKALSMFAAIRSDTDSLVSSELQKYAALKLNEDEKEALFDFTNRMPIQDYFLYAEDIDANEIDSEIIRLEKKFTDSQLKGLDLLIDFNVDDEIVKNTPYNIGQLKYAEGEKLEFAKKLVVLKSIKRLGIDRFTEFRKNTDAMDLVKDTVLANEMIKQDHGLRNMQVRDNQMIDHYDEAVIQKVITYEELNNFAYEEKSGWKVLIEPTPKTLGLVYHEVIDSTFQEGAFTDIRLSSGDKIVDKKFKNDPRVVAVEDGYKYIIPRADKMKMGATDDASQGLVRAMAHNMAIVDSRKIRDLIVSDSYWNFKENDMDNLEALIKDKERDHPAFLGGDPDIKYTKLPKRVQAKYMPVSKKMSDDRGFDEKIMYVRKDQAHWLVGVNDRSLATDPKLKWVIRTVKNLVTGTKIGQVILNPMKILIDNASNLQYLGIRIGDPLFIQRSYRQISAEWHGYKKIKNDIMLLQVKGYARPNDKSIQKKLARLYEQQEAHPSNGMVERGFINSLGSDIISNANDPSSGFKKDLDKVLKVIFERKGKSNEVGQFLMKFSKWGVGLEEFLETLSPVFNHLDSTKNIGQEIDRIADRLRNIKTEDDLVSYMHQYINSPGSEFVKLGSHMTDLTDILAKETLYRYLVENGVDPKQAEQDVIFSFPDYKEALPTHLKKLSDVGILMYPSYWIRIQKSIFRMARDQPVSLGSELAIQRYFEINAHTIFDQNIWIKATEWFGIFHNPWTNMGVGSIAPLHVTG